VPLRHHRDDRAAGAHPFELEQCAQVDAGEARAAMTDGPVLVERMRRFGNTIFGEMSALAVATGAINLGQGFPDTDGPAEIVEAAVAAMRAGHNQYPPATGIEQLRVAIADHQRRSYGLSTDTDREEHVS